MQAQLSHVARVLDLLLKTIRIHHECEGAIEKSVLRNHCLSSLGGFFNPILTFMMDSFSCSPFNAAFYVSKRLSEVPEYAEMHHDMMAPL